MNTKRAPKVRFKGFTDAWELRKLGEITNSYSGGTPSVGIDEYYDGKIPFIRSGEINSESTEFFLTETGLNNSSAKMVNVGDILYALYGATSGEVGVSRICGAINQAILAIIPDNGYDTYFIMQWLRREKQNIVSTYLQGGQGNLSGTIVKDLSIDFPNTYIEQEKIGGFFRNLDNLITLHQRKLDKMKELRKAFLNLIFSQKLRFRGFTDSWELRKLGEITEKITRKNQSLESLLPLTISAQHGLIDQNSFFNKQIASKDVSGYYLIKNGEFAYNKSYSNAYPWGAIKRLDLHDKGVLSTLYIVFKPTNVESNFLVSYYSADNWHKEVSIRAAEGARNHGLLNISPQDFFETKLLIPNKYEEQEKIGVFFKKLDNLIIFNQDKINRLKNVKKILLRNMLI